MNSTEYYVFKATYKDDERFYIYNLAIEDVIRNQMTNTVHEAIRLDLEKDGKNKSDYKIIVGKASYKYIQKNGIDKWKFIEPVHPGDDVREPYHFSDNYMKYNEYQNWLGRKRAEGFHHTPMSESDRKVYITNSRDREGKELRKKLGI